MCITLDALSAQEEQSNKIKNNLIIKIEHHKIMISIIYINHVLLYYN